MKACPYCGCDCYTYIDWGLNPVFVGIFDEGTKAEECADYHSWRPKPIFVKCGGCGKKIRRSDIDEK